MRKSNRLKDHDYSSVGYYFVTVCTKKNEKLFGEIVGATALGRPHINLTSLGVCLDETIQKANNDAIKIDKYAIMPNHIHMIVILTGDRGRSPLQHVIRNIKSFVTKYAGFSLWQKSFHDHIIRNEIEYRGIWQYIDENPSRWIEDEYNQ
ncbi:MAG: transposase [Oscillospiraceae bacterium]|nr:transposase [Oscillospiraceae bacterium]